MTAGGPWAHVGGTGRPRWSGTIGASSAVEIQIGRERQKATSRILGPADPDYERLWKVVNEGNHDRYRAYQDKTSRPIPIVILTPS